MASSNINNTDSSMSKPLPSLNLGSHQPALIDHPKIHDVSHVVIIGAGMSGLSAGLQLVKQNYDVVIVEARNRVGGRIETREFKELGSNGKAVIDLGASFLHGIDGNPLVDLMKEFKQPVHFDDEDESVKIYSSEGPALAEDVTKKLVAHAYHTFFESARTDAQEAEMPNMAASLGSYLYDPKSPLYDVANGSDERAVLAHLVGGLESWTGAALEQVALRWWGFEREFLGKDGVVTRGYGALMDLMAREFVKLGGKLMIGHECLGIEHDSEAELMRTYVQPTGPDQIVRDEGEGRIPRPAEEAGSDLSSAPTTTLKSSYTICTLPLGVLKAIVAGDGVPRNFFNPPLPARRRQAIERTGYGLLNKVIVRYERVWWPADAPWLVLLPLNQPGSFPTSPSSSVSLSRSDSSSLSSVSSAGSSPSSVWPSVRAVTADASLLESTIFATSVKVQNYVPITGEAALVFFFGASAGEAIEELTDDAVAEMVHAKLVAHLDVCEEEEPEGPSECIVTRWRSDRFSRGSYAFIPPYSKHNWNEEPATPLDIMEMSRPLWNGRLGFAGEHCQVDHYACVHGPYLSGMEQAERIHAAIQASASALAPASDV